MLTVTDLTCARGGTPVLSGVNFTVEAGAALVLRGPNGVGKTTLLRTVAGLQPALRGRIEGAEDAIAYAAHSDGHKAQLTVAENLDFWRGVYGGPDVGAALEAFGLSSLLDRRAGKLSFGQRRRLSLARLMVTGRPVWILDEPTSNLDAASIGLFAAAARRHLAAGGAALIATHTDLGIEARELDLTPHRAAADAVEAVDPFACDRR